MQRSRSSCWAGIETSLHTYLIPLSERERFLRADVRRETRQMEVESKNSSGSRTDCRVWVWTVYSRNPRELRNVHTPPPALSCPPWLSERSLKLQEALCVYVRARAQGDRASTHLSPLIIWSNLRKGEPLWLLIIPYSISKMDKHLYCDLFDIINQYTNGISQNQKCYCTSNLNWMINNNKLMYWPLRLNIASPPMKIVIKCIFLCTVDCIFMSMNQLQVPGSRKHTGSAISVLSHQVDLWT